MSISRLNLTPEGAGNESCHGCKRRALNCYGSCADYATETIMCMLACREHAGNSRLAQDMYHLERARAGRRLR